MHERVSVIVRFYAKNASKYDGHGVLIHYGEFHVGCRRRLIGEKVFRQIYLWKVLAARTALIFIALVIESTSRVNLLIYRWGTRVGFDDPIHALRSTNVESGLDQSCVGRRLLGLPLHEQAKVEALNKLEDVLFEPPRAASETSRTYQRRTKYLSDLMGDDSLKSYSRRVFIDMGPTGSDGAGWLARTYPTNNLNFETYEMETLEEGGDEGTMQMGVSEWVKERVKEEEEFVVMNAEAEAVEEMVKSKAIRLVDELFLECKTKNKGDDNNNNNNKKKKKKKKAYWECLALYGKLRDEGLAVHQWWG